MFLQDETIVAAATGAAVAPIAIIRISGKKSLEIFRNIFKTKKRISSHRVFHGLIINPCNHKTIDDVLAWYLAEPRSFTGEEMVEISCHGSPQIVNEIIEVIIGQGGRMAERGEFTKRAFLNGKIDLTQAEAIIDLIKAKTENSADSARKQIAGKLRKAIEEIREEAKQVAARMEAAIDFPDDIEETEEKREIERCYKKIKEIKATAEFGRIAREGARLAIIGRPNVGKSSLLNKLLKEDRAIVADLPGTTRDTIEEQLNIRGYLINIIDTAGIHDHEVSMVERKGIERSRSAANEADIILFVCEATDPFNAEDMLILNSLEKSKTIKVVNKTDLKKHRQREGEVAISVINDKELTVLEDRIVCLIEKKAASSEYGGVNKRQKERLIIAEKALERCITAINSREPADIVSIDLKEGIIAIGEISGYEATEEVINEIFDRFCIGK
ncbi:MAG: tRNA uridine-5-carboxymethylaminomethyl(34) synthesis GTPase MnmE [Candidatus Margulisbacteria bacterium]|nr:tRNA uridine-5-carboxymethylaminomethyl(34) synthesis GTPase MnmE [Candidatus Margulisiibacteriota bacterium]MBU1616699.1 tRNA uridine-5-carboxymethylaminomethyl(34) synthesis GTPase MnmE [Candidatus Margulisiibacteriota bacterium]